MTIKTKTIAALTIVFFQGTVYSADLADSDIIGFSPNTPVSAGDFNTNFNNVKDAINTKQDKISNGCGTGQYIQIINANGTVVCQPDLVGSGGGGGITGVISQDSTGINADTNISGVVNLQLNNDLLNNNAINALKAADGAGSNVDADLLDGRNSTDFASSDQSCGANQAVTGVDVSGNVTCTNHISDINPGSTMTGGGNSGSVALDVDTTVIQRRVTGGCPIGQSIRIIDQDGGVSCETDDDNGINSVTAGDHLSLSGSANDPRLDVIGMPGIAFIQNLSAISVGSSYTSIATLSINAPAAGLLLVNFSKSLAPCGDSYDGFVQPQVYLQKVGADTVNSPVGASTYVFTTSQANVDINVIARCVDQGGGGVNGSVTIHNLNAVYFGNNITGP